MNLSIPYGRQSISQNDIDAVVRVLQSEWITQGPVIDEFEKAVATFCGAEYAVAVNSATSALHIACLALGLGPGDTVWTSPNSFVASANCAMFCGAFVNFVDIDPQTGNLSVENLEQKLVIAESSGNLPKILIPVHFAGQPCEMEDICRLARKYGILVVEDASHAIGARYQNDCVGSCRYSDMTVFSFHPVKILTTGEGGMVLTNNQVHFEKLLRLRNHGITRNQALFVKPSPGPWYYEQLELGFNYRMTDIQAALGLSQLSRLELFLERRNHLAERYNMAFQHLPLTLLSLLPGNYSSWHLYVVRLQLEQIRLSHKEVFEALRSAGIQVNLHYIPIHTQPYYQSQGFSYGDFPNAEQHAREAVSLPIFFELGDTEQAYVIEQLQTILS